MGITHIYIEVCVICSFWHLMVIVVVENNQKQFAPRCTDFKYNYFVFGSTLIYWNNQFCVFITGTGILKLNMKGNVPINNKNNACINELTT